jgi:hypothetical protein
MVLHFQFLLLAKRAGRVKLLVGCDNNVRAGGLTLHTLRHPGTLGQVGRRLLVCLETT